MAKIRIGLVGCGFVSELHMYAYRRVYGVDVEVNAVAARGDHVVDFAGRHQIPRVYRSFRDLMADGELDVVDICTPPSLHTSMIVDAMKGGKHVICEKPFTGYFGREGDKVPIGKHVPKALMYERVLEEMEKTCAAIKQTGKLFMYAEDWIYAPAVTKTVEILKATKDKILFMKGEESHSGSHAAHAAQWAMTGGGSLIRMGCHPLSAVLYLKQVEAKARGEAISALWATGTVTCCAVPSTSVSPTRTTPSLRPGSLPVIHPSPMGSVPAMMPSGSGRRQVASRSPQRGAVAPIIQRPNREMASRRPARQPRTGAPISTALATSSSG